MVSRSHTPMSNSSGMLKCACKHLYPRCPYSQQQSAALVPHVVMRHLCTSTNNQTHLRHAGVAAQVLARWASAAAAAVASCGTLLMLCQAAGCHTTHCRRLRGASLSSPPAVRDRDLQQAVGQGGARPLVSSLCRRYHHQLLLLQMVKPQRLQCSCRETGAWCITD